jgi:Co/Zn/Cd efflux system component
MSVKAKTLQTVAMAASVVFVPIAIGAGNSLGRSELASACFLVALYACVVTAVSSTIVRYRNEQRGSLAQWRRIPYRAGLVLLLTLCLCPFATWHIAQSGVTLHLRSAYLGLFGANIAAVILVWFGSGWSRLGLTVVACWICFLWASPLISY